MQDNDTTPDQVAAGAYPTPEQRDQGGMVDALRSRGTLPAGLADLMIPPQAGANAGLAAGSAVLNAQAGINGWGHAMQSQNPYLDQQFKQGIANQESGIRTMALMDRMKQRQWEQQNMAWKMTDDMVKSDDRDARELGWKTRAQIGGPLGVQIPPKTLEGLARGHLSPDQMKKAIGMFDSGAQPEDVGRVLRLDPELVKEAYQISGSDGQRRMLGYMTQSEAEAGKAKDELESLKLAKERWGLQDPKDPRVAFATGYTESEFGVPFNRATPKQQAEAVEKAAAVAKPKVETTATIKNALAEAGLPTDTKDEQLIQDAVNKRNARVLKEKLQVAGTLGQLSQIGGAFGKELDRVNQNDSRLNTLDDLVGRMDRLITEGKSLGLTNNPKAVNFLNQEIAQWFASGQTGKLSKGAQWLRAWDTLDAQFGTVAQAIEKINGNRLAQASANRALGFHPKATDSWAVQTRTLNELKRARDEAKAASRDDLSRVMNMYQGAAGKAGVPFILGGGHGQVESVEEE